MTNNQPVKACPFCGGEAKMLQLATDDYMVRCETCWCQSPETHREGDARNAWETRTPEPVKACVTDAMIGAGVQAFDEIHSVVGGDWKSLKVGEIYLAMQSARVPAPSEDVVEQSFAEILQEACSEHFDAPGLDDIDWADIAGTLSRAIAALSPAPTPDRISQLVEAAQAVVDRKSDTFKARNGRNVGIQGDDGEKCFIIHSDEIFELERALASHQDGELGETTPKADAEGGGA